MSKSMLDRLAEDIRHARWKVLRKISIDDAYYLMVLREDLLNVSQRNWLDSLSNRYERGQHHLKEHFETDDDSAQEIADSMAADMRVLRSHMEEMIEEPVTVERLLRAEEIFRNAGLEMKLVDRGQIPKDLCPN